MVRKSGVAVFVLSMTLAAAVQAAPAAPPAKATFGGGPQPDIELSTTSLLFGEAHVFGSTNELFTVSNVGVDELHVTLYVTGASATQFYVADPGASFQISPGGQVEVTMTFFAIAVGTQEASLEVHSDDPVDPILVISLSGNGYESNLLSLTGTPDPVSPGGTLTFTVVLDSPAGPGDVDVSITTSPTILILVPPTVTVPQGETEVQFQATAGTTPGIETVYALLRDFFAYDEIAIQDHAGVGDGPVSALALGPILPHPIRRGALVAFTLPAGGRVRLSLFDVSGRAIAILADGDYPAGRHEVEWRAAARPGLYFLRLDALGATRVLRAAVAQ